MNYNNLGATPVIPMKWVIILTCVFSILIASMLFAGKVSAQQVKTTDKELKDTVIRNVTYKLYLGSRGGRYYFKTSAKGNVYKVYIPKKKL